MYQSYVYKVTNRITNQFYYGSRTENVRKNRLPEEDLWKHYFTSSKKVKDLIDEYGIDSFDVEILSKHDSYEDCFWEEQRLIKESKDHPNRLNKAWVDPDTGKKVLTTWNETKEEKKLRIEKMALNKKGRFNSNGHYGLKHTEETKKKIAEQKGWKHTDEAKRKMRKPKGPMPEWRKEIYQQKAAQGWTKRREKYGENGRSK
jgi:hypothetical protein